MSSELLTEADDKMVATCAAFIGNGVSFNQALLDASDSIAQELCVRCGNELGYGAPECLICQGIRNVMTLKKVRESASLAPEEIIEEAPVEVEEPGLVPWTDKELNKLRSNRHLTLKTLRWLFKERAPEEIEAKLKDLK